MNLHIRPVIKGIGTVLKSNTVSSICEIGCGLIGAVGTTVTIISMFKKPEPVELAFSEEQIQQIGDICTQNIVNALASIKEENNKEND